MLAQFIFVATVFSVFFCTAVNAYTLQLGYPIWAFVGREAFATVHREYMQRLNWVITAPHVLMFFSSALLIWLRPACVESREAIALFGLCTVVILVSASIAGTVHGRFDRAGVLDDAGLRLLLQVSALRVVLMLAASGVVARWLLRAR